MPRAATTMNGCCTAAAEMPSSGLGVDERGALGEPGGGKDDAEGGEDDPDRPLGLGATEHDKRRHDEAHDHELDQRPTRWVMPHTRGALAYSGALTPRQCTLSCHASSRLPPIQYLGSGGRRRTGARRSWRPAHDRNGGHTGKIPEEERRDSSDVEPRRPTATRSQLRVRPVRFEKRLALARWT